MIREKKTKKEVSGNGAFLTIILLSVGIIFMSSIIGYVENKVGIKHMDYIIYILIVVIAYFLIKNYLTEFRYSFIDDELIVEKILGKRITPIVTIKTKEIEHFGKLSDIDWLNKDMHVDYCDISKRKAYAIKYSKNGEVRVLTLTPSEELVAHINKSLESRDYDELDEEKLLK